VANLWKKKYSGPTALLLTGSFAYLLSDCSTPTAAAEVRLAERGVFHQNRNYTQRKPKQLHLQETKPWLWGHGFAELGYSVV
jgi:hypothetical protein